MRRDGDPPGPRAPADARHDRRQAAHRLLAAAGGLVGAVSRCRTDRAPHARTGGVLSCGKFPVSVTACLLLGRAVRPGRHRCRARTGAAAARHRAVRGTRHVLDELRSWGPRWARWCGTEGVTAPAGVLMTCGTPSND
ncbi:hypothetical protein Shyhy01_20740 [Streptomyces hygroscopicus subsp. hygroscopicus]|nr:hypothetical protein Shyhy01_20740 [Streptomyces hygroscopicus subsp. hygroscopicus]